MPFLLPIVAAIGGGSAALGAAAIGSAAIGAGTAIYASGQQKKASQAALQASQQASQQQLAAQQAALDRITALQSPFVGAGTNALGQLAGEYGLGGPRTSPQRQQQRQQQRPPPRPPGQPQGFGPTAAGDAAYRAQMSSNGQTNGQNIDTTMNGLGGGSPPPGYGRTPGPSTLKASGGMAVDPASAEFGGMPPPGQPGAPQAVGPDWNAYLTANPDVASTWLADHPPASVGDVNKDGRVDQGDSAALHYQMYGQNEGRPLTQTAPVDQPQAQPDAPQGPPPDLGTASPVVPSYTRGPQGQAPNQADFFDRSQFQTSPGYEFRLNEGMRNLNSKFGARGLLQSGSAIQGAIDYGQGAASSEYGNWFNQQQQRYADATGQFNTDRSFNNANYESDRGYGTDLALNNRNFANQQQNTRIGNLFSLAQIGTGAAGATGSANSAYANNAGNIYGSQAQAAADAAAQRASANAGLAGTLGGIGTNLFNSYSSGGYRPMTTMTSGDGGGYGGGFTPPNTSNAFSTGLKNIPSYSYGRTY